MVGEREREKEAGRQCADGEGEGGNRGRQAKIGI